MAPPRTPARVRVSNSNRVFDGYLKVDRYELSHELYCGDWSQTLVREVMDRGEVAAVLPFDPVCQEVVLIEQFRVGAWAASWQEPWLLECVAGVMHEGESAGEVAIREAHEETGCEVTDLELVYRYFPSSGACTELVDLFCGRVDASTVDGIHGLAAEGEDIYARAWPLADALALLDTGRICNSVTLIALQWLALNHQRLTSEWLRRS